MFLRCSTRKKDGKGHRYFSIVENKRVAGGRVVQRHVLYLGEINSWQELAWRKSIEVFEDGAERPSTLSLFPADRCEAVIPDANIAHGISSVIAQRMALAYADYVVNEAGFAADLGAEKYLDIVMPSSEIKPSAAVLGATVRAIRRHDVNAADLKPGLDNLAKHGENLRKFCLPTVVAVNRSHDEIEADLDSIRKFCTGFGVESAFAEVFEKDREGGRELAEKMLHAAEQSNTNAIQPLYSATLALEEKIAVVAKEIYGADGIEIRPDAKSKIAKFTELGFAGLPVCIAKTQHSLSDDPKKLGAPKGWRLTVNDAHWSSGAGFIVAIAGSLLLMPGLPKTPQAVKMSVADDGTIRGVS